MAYVIDCLSGYFIEFILLNNLIVIFEHLYVLVSVLEEFFQIRKNLQEALINLFLRRIITYFFLGTDKDIDWPFGIQIVSVKNKRLSLYFRNEFASIALFSGNFKNFFSFKLFAQFAFSTKYHLDLVLYDLHFCL